MSARYLPTVRTQWVNIPAGRAYLTLLGTGASADLPCIGRLMCSSRCDRAGMASAQRAVQVDPGGDGRDALVPPTRRHTYDLGPRAVSGVRAVVWTAAAATGPVV